MPMKVARLSIYPIKATGEVTLSRADVELRGLSGDRRWMVVDANGDFLQQRNRPRLALVQSALSDDRSLRIEAPGMSALVVSEPQQGLRRSVQIWRDRMKAPDAGEEAADWFSQLLGEECRLVFMDAAASRPIPDQYALDGGEVSFADAMPLLLATEASLADLNRRLNQPLPMSRFRPNVTIDGRVAWEEDDWQCIRIGNVEFTLTHRCARCVVTTIDQHSGEKDDAGEPLKTLAGFRRDSKGIYFGMNMAPRTTGALRVGDRVEVISRRQ